MGLWKILTTDINLTGAKLRWREPMMYRARLRRDVPWRVLTVLGTWFAGTGVMALVFSINVKPPSIGVAFGLGAVIGLGPAILCLFLRRGQVSGAIQVHDDCIQRKRTYAGLTAQWAETSVWGFDEIEHCQLAPGSKLHQPFHAMFFKAGGEAEIIGIPASVDLKKLRALLSSRGIEVAPSQKVPDLYRRPLAPALAGILAGVGSLLMGVGIIALNGVGPQGNRQQGLAATDQDLPGMNQQQFVPPQVQPAPFSQPTETLPGAPAAGFDFSEGELPLPDASGPLPADKRSDSVRPGFPVRPAATETQPGPAGVPSELIGGRGGAPFTKVSAAGEPVFGVRYRMGTWAGKQHLGQVEPCFESTTFAPDEQTVVAKSGYVVGAVDVHASDFVDGLRLVFMKLTSEGTLDTQDSYLSDWIGIPSEKGVRLERNGNLIIGLHGKGAAVLDSIGVVYSPAGE